MLMKTKDIRKKSKNYFFVQKFKKRASVWPRGSNNQNLKEIPCIRFRDNCVTDDGRIAIS